VGAAETAEGDEREVVVALHQRDGRRGESERGGVDLAHRFTPLAEARPGGAGVDDERIAAHGRKAERRAGVAAEVEAVRHGYAVDLVAFGVRGAESPVVAVLA